MSVLLSLAILLQLDSVVGQRSAAQQQRAFQIENEVSRYASSSEVYKVEQARRICDLYYDFDNDSAIVWAQRSYNLASSLDMLREQQLAVVAFSRSLSANGEYAMAYQLLNPEEVRLHPDVRLPYYRTLYTTAYWQAQFSTHRDIREKAESDKRVLLDKVIGAETDTIWQALCRAIRIGDSLPSAVIAELEPYLRQVPPHSEYAEMLGTSVGQAYWQLYEADPLPAYRDSAIVLLARSAIINIRHGDMEHSSLRSLALILIRMGDIRRAYDYLSCCIDDARRGKMHMFTVRMAEDMPLIMSAYEREIEQQQRRRTLLIIALSALAAFLLLSLLVVARFFLQRRRANRHLEALNAELMQVNAALLEANQKLRESGRIRDTYVTRYMTDCSTIIEVLHQYQRNLLRTVLSDQPKQLIQMVKSTDTVDRVLRTFYQRFDEAFLSIFPDFIAKFNALLRPGEGFPEAGTLQLNTELRIYALIRLGISDTDQIASFLRLSAKTVQNNRAMMRNRALDRNLLEQQVMQIDM